MLRFDLMSKIVTFLLIIFIFHLLPVFPKVLATEACNGMGITYSPDAFSANPTSLKFDFKISGQNTIDALRNKEVRLSLNDWLFGDYKSGSITIISDSFPITLERGGVYRVDPLQSGTHTAVLDWRPNPVTPGVPVANEGYEELCSQIVYTVGNPNTCVIDPDLCSTIRPGTKLTIRFSGKPRTEYTLAKLQNPILGGPTWQRITAATTYNDGQGEFRDVEIPGRQGETVDIKIGIYHRAEAGIKELDPYCSKQIKIDLDTPVCTPGAGPVPTAGPGAVPGPGGQPAAKPAGPPTVAGGLLCGAGDSGIQTAIGCINTSPAGFARDILKFAIGIGGGLAFLMMLLGAFQMLTSQGNPEILKAGQDRLTSAVIGLLLVIFATLFLQIIGVDILKLEGFGR